MHDAHFHYSPEIARLQKENGIPGLCNVQNAQEEREVKEAGLLYSVGVHPWDADRIRLKEMEGLLEEAPVIGEIGMDNVWCDTDLSVQRDVFVAQIQFAARHGKPVILHTKGMEREILDIIRQYPNTYIVHWYSAMEYLQEYDAVASYFTVGPSVGTDPAVTQLAEKVSMEKLLMESDGLDAIEWAVGNRDYIDTLKHAAAQIARIKGLSYGQAEAWLDENFAALLQRVCS